VPAAGDTKLGGTGIAVPYKGDIYYITGTQSNDVDFFIKFTVLICQYVGCDVQRSTSRKLGE